jgi:hypothetical protein
MVEERIISPYITPHPFLISYFLGMFCLWKSGLPTDSNSKKTCAVLRLSFIYLPEKTQE